MRRETYEELVAERDRLAAQVSEAHAAIRDAALGRLHLRVEARTDSLTGACTRSFFLDQVDLTTASAGTDKTAQRPAVIMIDIDNFKSINDAHGHHVGDEVLVTLADRFRTTVGDAGLVARFGGDEFAVLVYDADTARSLASDLLVAARRPIDRSRFVSTLNISVGIAKWKTGVSDDALLRHADAALYEARRRRTSLFEFDAAIAQRLDLERVISEDLPQALRSGQIALVAQPIVNLRTAQMQGVEFLSRWEHPDRGTIAPPAFIDVAERFQLIGEFDLHTIACALDWYRSARREKRPKWPVPISINVSPLSLTSGFATAVEELLTQTGIPPHVLTLEITETAEIRDVRSGRAALYDLDDLGVRISLDDFGTGSSSLTYVHDLPISELKVDRSFVIDLLTDRKSRELVRAIINVASALDLRIVAESVESEQQALMLRNMGCGSAQGYFFSRPVAPTLLAKMHRRVLPLEQPFTDRIGALLLDGEKVPGASI